MNSERHNRAVRERYDRLARRYDQRWAAYIGTSVRHTIDRLHLMPGEQVLDVGCGTGALHKALGDNVVGLDLSLGMLTRGSGARVAGDVRRLPFVDAAFDVVTSTSSLHYWVSPVDALREIRRVTKPRGRLVMTDWCDDYLACRICDRLLRLTHSGGYVRAYGTRELRHLVETAGYEAADVEKYKIVGLWGLMTVVAIA